MTTPTYTSLRHKIAAASATKRANHLQWASDLARARDVAVAAVAGLTPTPMVVADRDGVVVIPQDMIASVLSKLPDIRQSEAAADEAVRQGAKLPAFLK